MIESLFLTKGEKQVDRPEWADRLRRERTARNWSQEHVVRAMRTIADRPLPEDLLNSYKRYERGKHFPVSYTLLLAAVFDTDTDTLFGSRPTRPPIAPALELVPMTLHSGDWSTGQNTELAELVKEGVEVPITAQAVSRLVHEWLVGEPPQLVELHAGRRIGDTLVCKVERRIADLRRIDDFVAGGDLHRLVEQELHATTALLSRGSYTETLGRRLLVAVGELCQLAGWVFSDAGLHERAPHVYLAGIRAAHAADDRGLAGNLVSTLSYQVANVGDPREPTLLAQSAVAGTKDATPAVQALFHDRLAWTYAKSGDRRSAERSLVAVDKAFDKSVAENEPESLTGSTRTKSRSWPAVVTSNSARRIAPCPCCPPRSTTTTNTAPANWRSTRAGSPKPTSTAEQSKRQPMPPAELSL